MARSPHHHAETRLSDDEYIELLTDYCEVMLDTLADEAPSAPLPLTSQKYGASRMPYVKSIKSEKIVLPSDPHYHIMWRVKARYGDIKQATQKAVAVSVDARGQSARPEFDTVAYTSYAVLAHVESWNLDDADGKPLPLSVESFDLLDEEDMNLLLSKLDKETEGQGAERKK